MSELELLALIDNKNRLVVELHAALNHLSSLKVDQLCDGELKVAVANHIAIELSKLVNQYG